MKKGLFVGGLIVAVILILLAVNFVPTQKPVDIGKLSTTEAFAYMMNAENLIFTYINDSDTTATGDSVLAISGFTSKDEIRFAIKLDQSSAAQDSLIRIIPYTDSLTYSSAGYVTPATFTYADDFIIVWRDKN